MKDLIDMDKADAIEFKQDRQMLFLKYDRFRMAQFKDEADKPLKLRVLDDEKLATFKTRIH